MPIRRTFSNGSASVGCRSMRASIAPVAPVKIAHGVRDEPRITPIERHREETRAVEDGAAFPQPENLLRDLAAEIRTHRHTCEVVSHAVPDAVVAAHMRHHVESAGADSGPQK